MNSQKIYIAGHTGLVGSALVRYFSTKNNVELVLVRRSELDLTDQKAVQSFFAQTKPDIAVIAAGRVGGIQANSKYPADFIYQNIMIETNLIHSAHKAGVKRLLNFGSSCVYPRECPQPMKPEHLLSGKFESTNEPYSIAKLAGMSLCESYSRQYGVSYINAIPSNLYGPGDTFDLERCHVISALIRKFHEAKISGSKEIVLWGSGNVKRDFLYVDDFAKACAVLLESYRNLEPINISAQIPCTIHELASLTAEVVGFRGRIVWDTSKPDGASERVLDASEIFKLQWRSQMLLSEGLQKTYDWFLKEESRCAS